MELKQAYQRCQELADSHYENFPVAKLVPKKIRKNVAAVYAFARTADDIADENHDEIEPESQKRTDELDFFESQLDLPIEKLDPKWDWIFTALSDTIKNFDIPCSLFRDLISAFKQDVVKKRYEDFNDLLDYCTRSANPVGRLVLLLHGYKDKKLFDYSDHICTALQLANFWQDMSVDKSKNRIYIPMSDWKTYGVEESDFFKDSASQKMRDCVKFQVERTESLFKKGETLPTYLKFPLSFEISLTLAGGRSILKKITSQKFDTLARRPALNSLDKIRLLLSSLF